MFANNVFHNVTFRILVAGLRVARRLKAYETFQTTGPCLPLFFSFQLVFIVFPLFSSTFISNIYHFLILVKVFFDFIFFPPSYLIYIIVLFLSSPFWNFITFFLILSTSSIRYSLNDMITLPLAPRQLHMEHQAPRLAQLPASVQSCRSQSQ